MRRSTPQAQTSELPAYAFEEALEVAPRNAVYDGYVELGEAYYLRFHTSPRDILEIPVLMRS